jgi:hypothetical protein
MTEGLITPEEKAAVAQVESRIARMMREAEERLEKWRQRQIKKYGHVPTPIKCPKCGRPVGLKGDAPARKMHNPITGADYYQHTECKPAKGV